jgi:outer membrane protein assembly factor BamD (BamD/ComL family)
MWTPFAVQPPNPPAESLILRGDSLVEEKPPPKDSPEARLAGAHELFRRAEYGKAADLFDSLRDKKKQSEAVRIEATFYEAECYRLEARYPKAADLYCALFKDFPTNPYREQATQHLFEIANYWLEDTRVRMRQTREQHEHKRWFVDQQVFHMDKTKPFAAEETTALEKLEQVHLQDITGNLGLGDRALFLAGAVEFFNENYKDADHFLTQLYQHHKNSPLAPQAIELDIIAKTLSTGGADYDGRKVSEARALIQTAMTAYPELAAKKEDFLKKLVGIEAQQAQKDLNVAAFYERTKHLGSAWFYYKLVERRYPKTSYAQLAQKRMEEIRGELEKEGKPMPDEGPQPAPSKQLPPEQKMVPFDPGAPPSPFPSLPEGARPLR